jgi:hypothetical protein
VGCQTTQVQGCKEEEKGNNDQYGRCNLINLQPYIDRFDSMCNTYNGYNKVVLLAQNCMLMTSPSRGWSGRHQSRRKCRSMWSGRQERW